MLITQLTQSTITTITQQIQHTSIAEITTDNIINKCDPGYYLPEKENKCKKCSIFGCEICHGNNTINFCDSCFSQFVPKYINNSLTCIFKNNTICTYFNSTSLECLKCDNEYILYEGKCLAYSFVAIYISTSKKSDFTINFIRCILY